MNDYLITTHIGADDAHARRVQAFAATHELRFATRGLLTLAKLSRAHDGAPVAAWHATQGWLIRSDDDTPPWRWHPGLAHIRAAAASSGQPDRMTRALGALDGARVLDANLGLGRDALVIASSGAREVVGLEVDPVICALTREGLRRYADEDARLSEASRRVQCVLTCQRDFLAECDDDAFDRVYFSPMFLTPDFESSDMTGLRAVAAAGWPDAATLTTALRVAPRVVIKLEFGRHPPLPEPDEVWRKRRSRLAFWVYLRG